MSAARAAFTSTGQQFGYRWLGGAWCRQREIGNRRDAPDADFSPTPRAFSDRHGAARCWNASGSFTSASTRPFEISPLCGPNVNFVLVVEPHNGLGARSAPKRYCANQSRALPGYQGQSPAEPLTGWRGPGRFRSPATRPSRFSRDSVPAGPGMLHARPTGNWRSTIVNHTS